MTDVTIAKSPEDWLRWLGKEARDFHDPVCPDEAGDACLWAVSEIERLRAALEWYADQMCELGTAHECCGKMDSTDCSGCVARKALAHGG